ncbi:leucyl aminopeptidase family protein [Algoriphagus kandeliae]|uniref:Leucyl aminopeptidase family protein n=1 Tax=Algoriphagus kandeliae TaxID=2562278 RepID=A0A4Y9QYN4_9BACT|nr:leucyl aminopeptidase family protein [Algoriphagus kandeliae]TFV97479.1 leucyl aminopeptidase family protein [Algoriphagus kandeliae]
MKFQFQPKKINQGSLIVIPVFENQLEEFLKEKFPDLSFPNTLFSAKKDSHYLFPTEGNLVMLLGLGEDPGYKEIEVAFRRILAKNGDLVQGHVILDFPNSFNATQLEAALVGFGLGSYQADFFKKTRKNDFQKLKVGINHSDAGSKKILLRAEKILAAKIEAFRMVDLPPNVLTPEYLADWAKNLAKEQEIKAHVFDAKKAKKEGLEAFLAVARGSVKEPRFIILEYRHPDATKHVGLVGKGVTFDTGGLNIKTQGMHYMKSDMGGAAAVLAATQLIASLKVPVNLTTVVPAVENAVDQHAYLPSEVIGSHSGKSIEIVDTDAEGRLILADGLSYLNQEYHPDHLIDFATLTGSAVGTFGHECAALFSNDDKLSDHIQQAGMALGEKTWPLPIWKEYAKEMDSEIADIRNYHGKPIAGAITAATFLQAFTNDHPSWAHLDIAGVAFADSEFSKSKTGTAYGVGLLLNLIENHL